LLIAEAARRADFPEAIVYLQITRGTSPRHRGFPSRPNPTLVITVRELHPPKSLATGIRVITTADLRWARCDIKSVALLANVLAYAAAQKAGANDAIFVEADGTVTEATAGNVFVIGNRRLRTPPKGPKILSGVTRETILQAAPAAELECREERIGREELYGADEIFLSSTTAEVLPVVAVDGRQIGMGRPGKISEQIYEQFLKKFVGATASAR
jgi:D-alanine transaminase